MKKHSEIISFRAHEDLLRLIDQDRMAFGLSRGAWVKGVVLAHIHGKGNEPIIALLGDLEQGVDRVDAEVAKLQTNLGRVLFATLTAIGKMDPAKAKEIVRNKLLT
jgi:hypothetical protein